MKRTSRVAATLLAVGATLVSNAGAEEELADQGAESGEAGDQDVPTAGIFIEPLLAIVGFYEGDVNITIDDSMAVGLWGQFFDYTLLDTGISGFGVGVGAPIFVTGRTYKGMYVYPMVKYQQVDFDAGDTELISSTFYGPQVTLGYQWTFGKVFSLKIGGGLEYSFGQVTSDQIDESLSFEGMDYELDAAIGAVF